MRMSITPLLLATALLVGVCAASQTGANASPEAPLPAVPTCPGSPNCVSSTQPPSQTGADSTRFIAPLELTGHYEDNAPEAMAEVAEIVREMGGTVVQSTPQSLHATFTSGFFGFVDDLYVAPGMTPAPGSRAVLHVHSSSRTGYWDMGVNRSRVNELRTRLAGRAGL